MDAHFTFGGVVPIFRVANLAASIEYYVEILGFKLDWQGPQFASVSHDRCCIFLSAGDQGHPGAWVFIGVPDAAALFEDYQAKGAKVRLPPSNYPWALEVHIEDLDGNVLRLGSDRNPEQPWDDWLDMYGQQWKLTAGEWVRAHPGSSFTGEVT